MEFIKKLFKTNEKVESTSEIELRMIKKFKNAINNYIVLDGNWYRLNSEQYTVNGVVSRYQSQRRELLRIIGKWEKEIKKREENK